ncbi:MAG: DNA polymerase III subunit chi [Gammaproteobacteria bacterium]|nr:DNA polymerase III subunit chi [Gammaproteobacteria bacterium]
MRIDFYILQTETDRELFACRLIEKAFQQGVRTCVRTSDARQAARMDDKLWTFRPGSFIPHELGNASAEILNKVPVVIAWTAVEGDFELCINLHHGVLDDYAQFARLAEIIPADPESKALGRQRFAFYREQAVELHHHEV